MHCVSLTMSIADSNRIQAKGYPDISTRAFLRLLSIYQHPVHPPPPIYVLADFDPDGVAIMSAYKHGSWNLSHENENLVVPRIQWLGLRSRDLGICSGSHTYNSTDLLRLSGRDRKKAAKMLENSSVFQEGGEEKEWRRELQVMLMMNVKAEMEILGARKGGVTDWVEEQLSVRAGLPSTLTHPCPEVMIL